MRTYTGKSDIYAAAAGIVVDDATSTVLTPASSGALEVGLYEEIFADLLALIPVDGVKSVSFQAWGSAAASGTVGSTGWTAVGAAQVVSLGNTTNFTAARGVWNRQALSTYKFVSVIATITHVDQGAGAAAVAMEIGGEMVARVSAGLPTLQADGVTAIT